ncbi:MAG: HAD-IIB family hydrolase [Fusobacteriaceae bacterium]
MKKYILFSDLDGTLIGREKCISDEDLKSFNKFENLEIVLCTGRTLRDTFDIMKKNGLTLSCICSNGGEIYFHDTQKKEQIFLDENIEEIKSKIISYGFIYKICYNNYSVAVYDKNNVNEELLKLGKLTASGIKEIIDETQIYYEIIFNDKISEYNEKIDKKEILKIEIFSGDQNKKSNLLSELKTFKNIEVTSSHISSLEITAKNISKGNGITRFLLTRPNIVATIGIGDDENDISMFGAVDLKIAMGNANEKLKKQADAITKTRKENGVSYAIENIFKGEITIDIKKA